MRRKKGTGKRANIFNSCSASLRCMGPSAEDKCSQKEEYPQPGSFSSFWCHSQHALCLRFVSMMSIRGSKYLFVYFCSHIFYSFFLLCVYTKESEMLWMCVCLSEPFSVHRLLIQLEPPERLTANWHPLSLGAGVQSWLNKPRKSGERKRVKKHTSGPSRVESSGAEVSRPRGFEGPAAELQVTSVLFQDLPGEYSMCEHEESFGVSWL